MRLTKKEIKTLFRFIPAILYVGLIWYVSGQEVTSKISGYDKIIHIFEYGILGFLLAFGFNIKSVKAQSLVLVYCFLTGILLGVTDEIHQYFVPYRMFDIKDILADTVGIILGIFFYFVIYIFLSGSWKQYK